MVATYLATRGLRPHLAADCHLVVERHPDLFFASSLPALLLVELMRMMPTTMNAYPNLTSWFEMAG